VDLELDAWLARAKRIKNLFSHGHGPWGNAAPIRPPGHCSKWDPPRRRELTHLRGVASTDHSSAHTGGIAKLGYSRANCSARSYGVQKVDAVTSGGTCSWDGTLVTARRETFPSSCNASIKCRKALD
jgi:hypothetical protein